MKVLILFEQSGIVREAFRAKGHEAWSCDIEPARDNSPFHIKGDWTLGAYMADWDLVIMHPPCTALAVSGNRYYAGSEEREKALNLIRDLFVCPYPYCLENPVGVISTQIRKPDQYIQPWMFGHDASKKTGLWLQNLPLLKPTNIIKKDIYSNQTPSGQNKLGPSKERAYLRSITYQGIADAMADQWG